MTRLKRLDLSRNEITDASPLAALTNLNWLSLSGNEIADVSPLVGLTKLHNLNLRNNEIVDIGSLVANTGLGGGDKVYLRGNPLSGRALKEQIPALKARGVSVNLTN